MTPDIPIYSRRFATAALVRRFAESPLPRPLICGHVLRRFFAVGARREDVTFKRVSRQRDIRQRLDNAPGLTLQRRCDLQRFATFYNVLLRFTTSCNVLHYSVLHYSVLHYSVLQRFTTFYNVLQRFAMFYNVS